MLEGVSLLLALFGSILFGGGIGFLIFWFIEKQKIKKAESKSEVVIQEAEKKAAEISRMAEIERKDLLLKEKTEFDRERRERRRDLDKLERRLVQKEENIDRKNDRIEKREKEIYQKEKELGRWEGKLNTVWDEYQKEVEKLANLTANEAREMIVKGIQHEAELEAQKYVNKIESEAQITAERKARKIIVTAIQRTSTDVVSESCISTVTLPSDDMKGRIIGREGRNIRALENLTGVDIIIDDTPEAIVLSSFDPIRREVARQTIQKLISDGRIHPARIEEMVQKVGSEVTQTVREEGERACFDLGITGMPSELTTMVGRMMFRASYGQNLVQHSKEVAHIAGLIAAEIGANIDSCKRAGILHDIGKTVVWEGDEASHALIGAEIAKKHGESQLIINAIAAHHNEMDPQSVESVIIQTADAISASRPGARKESYENYVKRLEALEKIANQFEGVEKSFAIQAGRELRIFVNNENTDDFASKKVASDIAKQIEEEIKYPGQVKITLIRETRVIEYAK